MAARHRRRRRSTATFPPYPLEEKLTRDRDFKVTRAADYIADDARARAPSRGASSASRAKDTDLARAPAASTCWRSPSQIADTSWIRPGKVAWDWWNALNLRGVDFKPRREHRDLQALHRLRLEVRHRVRGPRRGLVRARQRAGGGAGDRHARRSWPTAREKDVGVILWVVWKTLDDQLQPALDQFEKWGVEGHQGRLHAARRPAGHRSSTIASAARRPSARCWSTSTAAIRPALLTRTWPNLHLHRRGAGASSTIKWSNATDPEHDVHAAVHAHVPGADGLHAGRDAQRHAPNFVADLRASR